MPPPHTAGDAPGWSTTLSGPMLAPGTTVIATGVAVPPTSSFVLLKAQPSTAAGPLTVLGK